MLGKIQIVFQGGGHAIRKHRDTPYICQVGKVW
jgi:hypothetical protein